MRIIVILDVDEKKLAQTGHSSELYSDWVGLK